MRLHDTLNSDACHAFYHDFAAFEATWAMVSVCIVLE